MSFLFISPFQAVETGTWGSFRQAAPVFFHTIGAVLQQFRVLVFLAFFLFFVCLLLLLVEKTLCGVGGFGGGGGLIII